MWCLKNIVILILISIVPSKRIFNEIFHSNNFNKDTVLINMIKSFQCTANHLVINKNLSLIVQQSKLIVAGKIVQKRVVLHYHPPDKVIELKIFIKRIFKNDVHFNKKFINIVLLSDQYSSNCDFTQFFMKKTAIFMINVSSVDSKYRSYILSQTPVRVSLHNLDIINSILNDNVFKIRQFEPEELCDTKHCNHGASCIMVKNKTEALCKCPDDCSTDFEPVCGTNSKTYTNYCHLRADSCKQQQKIRIEHTGVCELRKISCVDNEDCSCFLNCSHHQDDYKCGSNGKDYRTECDLKHANCQFQSNITVLIQGKCDPCSNVTCPEPEICQLDRNRIPQCNCGDHCPLELRPVCASDGQTYQNDCILRQESCRLRKKMHIIYRGKCSSGLNPCDLIKCDPVEHCVINKYGVANCECSTNCEQIIQPICASNGVTFLNDCELIQYRCRHKLKLMISYLGECNERDLCNSVECPYKSVCVKEHNRVACQCRNCTNYLDPVCGSDGITYENECKLSFTSCVKQTEIHILHKGYCDFTSNMCNYSQENEVDLGQKIDCSNGEICPNYFYCHHTKYASICCPISPGSGNPENVYVCNDTNCNQICNCNSFGSYSSSCDLATKKCHCKPGVTGLKCDRCKSGYWGGLNQSFEENNGCNPCDCSKFGSLREDCDQVTGKCFCKPNVHGHRCTVCVDNQMILGPVGCHEDLYNDESQSKLSNLYDHKAVLTKSTRHLIEPNYRYYYQKTNGLKLNNFVAKSTNYHNLGDLCYTDTDCPILFSFCSNGVCQCLHGYQNYFDKQECKKISNDIDCDVTAKNDTYCTNVLALKSINIPVFQGTSFIKLKPFNAKSKFSLEIELKTYDHHGIIFYAQNNMNGFKEFLSLALINGFVEFRYNLGDDVVSLKSIDALEFNKFTTIIVKRYHKDSLLKILPNQAITGSSKGNRKFLDVLNDTYVGFIPTNYGNIYDINIGTHKGFQGCVRKLKINDRLINMNNDEMILRKNQINECYEQSSCFSKPCFNNGSCEPLNSKDFRCICNSNYFGELCEHKIDACLKNECESGSTCIPFTADEYICSCPLGKFGHKCANDNVEDIKISPVMPKFLSKGFIKMKTEFSIHRNFFMEIWLKSYSNDGLIFFNCQIMDNNRIIFTIYLNDGFVHFQFEFGHKVYNIRSSNRIMKNEWQKVFITILENEIVLQLENTTSSLQFTDPFYINLKIRSFSFVGSLPTRLHNYFYKDISRKSLSGVIQRISINNNILPILKPLRYCRRESKRRSSSLSKSDDYCKSRQITIYDDNDGPCSLSENPCLNFGLCIPNFKEYFCNCLSNFSGKLCETSLSDLSDNNILYNGNKAISFNGKNYMLYKLSTFKRRQSVRKNNIEIIVKSDSLSGLIFWRGKSKSKLIGAEFLSIAIFDGFPEFSFKTKNQKKITTIRSNRNISDGHWHSISVKRLRKIGVIRVDDEIPVKITFRSSISNHIRIGNKFWLGGCQYLPQNLPKYYYNGFKGCLKQFVINSNPFDLFSPSNKSKLKFC